MGKHWIFLFLIVPNLGFSQCDDFGKLDFGGSLGSKSRHHIPFDLNISDTTKYCCDIGKIRTYSDFVISKAKAFIVARANEGFYRRLEIDQIDVNYPDSVNIVYKNQSLYNLSNFSVSYWIIYTYSTNNIKYGFGLEFNRNGEMISENEFPDFAKNIRAEEFTDICNALEVVNHDKRFSGKKVELIELAYVDSINSFCWLVKEKMGPMKCGRSEYALDLFYVNANTNKLEVVEQERGIVFVDCAKLRQRPRKTR